MRPLTRAELCQVLERHGFELRRVTGSHRIYTKAGVKATLSVPVHSGSQLKAGTQRALSRLAGIPPESV